MSRLQRVLIVDDESNNRMLFKSMVESLGYEAELARGGREALEKVGLGVDIVLLDVMMPEMDGYEVAKRIRIEPSTCDIPIVMVTILDSKEDRILAVEAGANDFISKPIDMVELRIRMESHLKVKRTQDQLKASLKEKEMLLREIHHRVKNNLAAISSLFRLQARCTVDDNHRRVFEDMQNRIRSMAIVHEKLYRSENLAEVRVMEYAGNLVDHLLGSTSTMGRSVTVAKKIEDVSVCLEKAIPLGIILTELVSNSLRHAFPEGRRGELSISFQSTGPRAFELIVKDNGIGMPELGDFGDQKSLGLRLVDVYSRQIGGTVEVSRAEGTEFRVRFAECVGKPYQGHHRHGTGHVPG